MQNILHYSPLGTGVRFLPATALIIVMGPLSGRLTDKVGPRPLMTLGLVIVAASIFVQSHITAHSGYLLLLPGFVLMGIGMGLVMSPMSTAAMNAVDRTKAGVASGVLSMSRMVGGTFGVAVMGALVTVIGRSKIDSSLPHLPAAARTTLVNSLGGGGTITGHQTPHVVSAVHSAFVSALSTGLTIGAATTFGAAVLAWFLIQPMPKPAQAVPAVASEAPLQAELARAEAAPEASLA
jgi:MFS family permease